MRPLTFFFFLLCALQSHSQCRKTFLYGFELTGIVPPETITATVFYKGKPIIPQTENICGKALKIKTQFTYLKNSGKMLNGITLPYPLPANRFYWLMTDDMVTEMAIYPKRFKIVLGTQAKVLKSKYELPVTYDFIPQNAIYLDLIDKSESNIQKEFRDKIFQFAVYEKQPQQLLKDTILVYSAKQKIPAGILLRFPELRELKNIHSTQEYQVSGMLYNNKLFLKMAESKSPKSDAQTGLYTTLDGKKCATSGGITGVGFGECSGADIKTHLKAIPYQINIQIEPFNN